MNTRRFLSFIFISLCFLGISCSFESDNYGSVGICLPTKNYRAANGDGNLPEGLDYPNSYTIKLTPNKGKIITKMGNAGEKIIVKNLIPGDYEIIVEGNTETNFFHGKTNVTIKAGNTEKAYITLTKTKIEPSNPGKPEVPTDGPITLAQAKVKIANHDSGLLELNINDVTNSNIAELGTAVRDDAKLNATISLDLSSCSSLTSVPANGFDGCDKLTKIVLPNSVTTISDASFINCSELGEITLGTGVKTIGNEAFKNCSTLNKVTMTNNVTTLGNSAFYGCSGLSNITLSTGLTSIGTGVFQKCGITTVNTLGKIKDIPENAFNGCSSLTTITIPDTVETIGLNAFTSCTALNNVTMMAGSNWLLDTAKQGASDFTYKAGSSNASQIKSNSDRTWRNMTIKPLTANEFTVLSLPSSSGSFNIEIASNAEVDSVGQKLPGSSSNLTFTLILKDGVTDVGSNLAHENIESVTIPGTMTTVGTSAFEGCAKLTKVVLNSGIQTIEASAFNGCIQLSGVVLPSTVTTLGASSFQDCSVLTSIDLSNVSDIGAMAFKGSGLNSATGLSGTWNIDTFRADLTTTDPVDIAGMLKDTRADVRWYK